MSVIELIKELQSKNIQLNLNGEGKLGIKAPPGALTNDLKIKLKERKSELLELLTRNQQSQQAQANEIKPVSREQPLPLSFAQQRLWLLHQLDPQSSAYNMSAALLLNGQLNLDALQLALNTLQFRHEVLRTVYTVNTSNTADVQNASGEPAQSILPHKNVDIAHFNFDDVSHGKKDDEKTCAEENYTCAEQLPPSVKQWLAKQSNQPFDLANDSVLRVQLVTLNEQQHVLQWVVHHIAIDAWSLDVIVKEFAILYNSACADQSASVESLAQNLSPLSIQYTDFSAWQREYLSGANLEKHINYWRNTLGDEPPVLEFPTEFPRPAIQTFNGARVSIELNTELTQAIHALAGESVSPFVVLLGTYQKLLQQYSGQQDIRVGVPNANRPRIETQSLVGFFVNTLVMQANFNGEQTVADYFNHVKQRNLEAQDHQDMPFEMLVDELVSERDMSHSPLFQVMFNFLQQEQSGELALDDLTIAPLAFDQNHAKFDLTLTVEASAEKYTCIFEYNTDLYSEQRISQFARQYQYLLQQLVTCLNEKPHTPIQRVSALTPEDIQQQLFDWNDSHLDVDFDQDVVQRFEQQVERTPNANAVISVADKNDANSTVAVSYAELNTKANKIAHYLKAHGVTTNSLVAVCLERNSDLLATLIGIQKAGGAYLPIDPIYPKQRRHYILEHAKPVLMVTEQSLLPLVKETLAGDEEHPSLSLPWLCFENTNDWLTSADESVQTGDLSADNLSLSVERGQLGYVLYTSGSTGKPKGVAISRGAFVNFLCAMQKEIQLKTDDKWLAVTTISFDIAGLELFLPLITGAATVVASANQARDPAEIIALLKQQSITIMQATPATWQMVVEHVNYKKLDSALAELHVLCGGEALNAKLANQLLARKVRLLNVYGPTETTVWSTCLEISNSLDKVLNKVLDKVAPIGRPIGNNQCYVLDENLSPVPVGALGELFIGGDGLAEGYLHRQDLTDTAFITNPLANTPGQRLYRTGDLVSYRHDGLLEYNGRRDFQVKIRGFRIELGEIERQLRNHDGVRDAVVTAYEDENQVKHLVGYLLVQPDIAADSDQLREFLAVKLPDYMVPSVYVELESFPLNSNGKVDRKALPKPNVRQHTNNEIIAPATDLEQTIESVWCEVLGLEKVSTDSNFFSIGGNSLSATRVVARLSEELAREIPLRTVFLQPTIALLAVAIEKELGFSSTRVVAIEKAPADAIIPLSFSQQRLWFLHQLEGPNSTYNMPVAISISGPLDRSLVEKSFSAIVARQSSLRTYFPSDDAGPQQRLHDLNRFTIGFEDLSAIESVENKQQTAKEKAVVFATAAMNVENDWLFAVTILKLDDQQHWLLVNCHHMIGDGWSVGVLIEEFAYSYQQFDQSANQVNEFSFNPLPIEYSDYSYWQHNSGAERFQEQLDYWLKQLASPPSLISLPTDHSRPAQQNYDGETLSVSLGEDLATSLQSLANEHGCTLYMVLMAAWQVLLHRYSGQDDICVGSPVANRQHQDTEALVGFFANTLVLRGDLSNQPTFADFLQQIKQVIVDAQMHQDVPFEQLVEQLNVPRTQAYSPLFQVMFTWQNTPLTELNHLDTTAGKLILESAVGDQATIDTGTAKFDLDLSLREYSKEISGNLSFRTDLFNVETVERLWAHFTTLLNSIVNNPSAHVGQLSLLLPEEKSQLSLWNNTEMAYNKDASVVELFEQAVNQHPDKIAARFNDESITYRELNNQANNVANHLLDLGVAADDLVAVCQRRSLPMLVSLIAVLKAGAAYVPIDPNYPQDRVAYMLEHSNVAIVLSDTNVIASSDVDFTLDAKDRNVLDINALLSESARDAGNTEKPNHTATGNHLAYVIYTSGSTGKPKGVMISRANMVNFVLAMQQLLKPTSSDRLLAVTSLSFDIAVLELFLPLISGGEVTLGDETLAVDGERLKALLDSQPFTFMQATPVSWKMLLAAGWQHNADRGAFNVLCGGEAFPGSLAQQLLAQPVDVWNLYGPTETTVWSSAHQLQKDQPVLIGKPIANTQIVIVDENSNPVPIGVMGELCIGGDGLARGYLHRSDLTEERFVDSEFGTIYRTGDLARYLPDGNLECLGRIDQQVKVRGYRIELGEIETQLASHELVHEAVVDTQKGSDSSDDENHLVAYVVLKSGVESTQESDQLSSSQETLTQHISQQQTPQHLTLQQETITAFKEHLNQALPDYMIPNAFMVLNKLPLTPNGKVDRKSLPKVDFASQRQPYVAPRDSVETQIQSIWQSLLKIDEIGIHDNFFDLGGHSLLATRLMSRIKEAYTTNLTLAQLFTAPTVAGVADLIKEESGGIEKLSEKGNSSIDDDALDRIEDLLAEFED
ncbi:non-ribosomal peptide synthetase [Sessilibacter corallicola]|uniref:non-ribosomal peptide synthetase n=1 Tax=Sessilibacter corallicola TaxID=2904075 RepID=UPI001E5CDE9B|nr:non-ribosomal peptide synthetase [Sessilibacter corallicola]MCE2029778.1 amino acid adenylation domain-containing protein [Sessilibacter corallicola]